MKVTSRALLAIILSLFLLCAANAADREEGKRGTRLTQSQECRLQRLSASQPTERITSEGGVTELWNENEEQFLCAGVAPMRNTIRRNSLSLPNFEPMPRLVYIERGQGIIGIVHPGCAETFQSQSQSQSQPSQQERGQGHQDQHQKVHRIRQGDIVAIPAGAAHWCYNDGQEDLVAISVNDLNHESNQLDQNLRAFYLAGEVAEESGQRKEGRQQRFHNIFNAFEAELMSQAFNIPVELVRKMQQEQKQRGIIVNVKEKMSIISPDEEQQEQGQQWWQEAIGNGLEENICSMKIRSNIEHRSKADIYSRQAGRIQHVTRHSLPILKYMDMSASKVNLYPNALMSPHWSVNGHCVVYVQKGDAQVQVVDQSGQQVMNDRVNQGSMFVVPQFFASTLKAGQNGFEFVVWRTSSEPMNSELAGYTSVIRAMPVEVLTNSYQMSPNEAQQLKINRGGESFLLSPQKRPF